MVYLNFQTLRFIIPYIECAMYRAAILYSGPARQISTTKIGGYKVKASVDVLQMTVITNIGLSWVYSLYAR